MEQAGEETGSRRHGTSGASAGRRRAADARALAVLPAIRKLRAAGFVSHRGLANEFNRRGIPAVGGGRWHSNTVRRLLTRLRQLTAEHRGINDDLAMKRAADVRAQALRPVIQNLRKAGFVSISAMARELNERGIPAPRGGKWHMTMVTRLLQRLERLDRASTGRLGRVRSRC
jgi:Recombinase